MTGSIAIQLRSRSLPRDTQRMVVRAGATSGAPDRGRILTGKPGFSDPTIDRGGGARSCTAVMPRETGAGVDVRWDGDDETVVCRWWL